MRLHDLLDGVPDAVVCGARRPADGNVAADLVDLDAVVCDSREASHGTLFACVPGARHDGHDHAEEAVGRGAAGLLVERELAPLGVPQILVPSVRTALGPIAAVLAGDPSRAMSVVGVTGTNGKTTVTYLLASIAQAAGRSASLLGTLGGRGPDGEHPDGEHPDGEHPADATFTTPEAPALQRTLASFRARGADFLAMEVSSHALHYRRVDGTRFSAVGFTNLSPEHLDLHGSLAEYFATKARLFSPAFSERAAIVVDDLWGERLAHEAAERGLEVVTVSGSETRSDVLGVQVRATEVQLTPVGSRFLCHTLDNGAFEVATPLLGAFNVTNAVLAIALAGLAGIAGEAIVRGLEDSGPVPGRLERVPHRHDFTLLVDYAHTPQALEAVLQTVRGLTPAGRVVIVYGCGGDRDRTKRAAMGRIAARLADMAFLTTDNPRSEEPHAIVDDVMRGLTESDARPVVEPDRRAAIAAAIDAARPGDVVVIAGKGHETGQTAHGVTVPFDDRVVAAELLEARSPRCG